MSHSPWHNVCAVDAILPGTGVCALIEGHQIALFRPSAEPQIYALDNLDPFARPACSPAALSANTVVNCGSPAR